MPRIRWLQTSDVHLRADRPERRRALDLVFDAVTARAADALLVAGDLFDRAADVATEREALRERIESIAPRPVVLVPGNHDAGAYGEAADFGANAVVLAGRPYTRAHVCGAELVGLPHQQGRTAAECLTGLACEPRHTVLIGHATLADAAAGAFCGEGEDGAHMPIQAQDVLRRFAYAALGHVHCGHGLVRREGERLIGYAGSPVATSRNELGPRCVLAVDFQPGVGVLSHELIPLATPSFERVQASCTPGAEEEAIARLARGAAALRRPGARVLAQLTGVSTLSEAKLREAAARELARAFGLPTIEVEDAAASSADAGATLPPILDLQVTSFAALGQTPVVAEFVARLEACATAEGHAEPRLLEAAQRLGLGAFLESLP